ncbi:hypothetical protein GCM10022297_13220 [Lactobacillus hamsteri]|uniref:Uncharacterized protein n=1 Tax=Lactobacillus hamsteri DSM 5661 = JCM 6256 TaxID=1423754 RepID=A0A0R1YF19_9LACO|nr:hypothetical protein [Lactobacillus hamsteri]KRM38166.1 hypothetical protein FC39_GL001406 [Lactobacillus hamsteri DSM 5661 = JCM 6256]
MDKVLSQDELDKREKVDHIMFHLSEAKDEEDKKQRILQAGQYLKELGRVGENASIGEIFDVYNADLLKRIRKVIKKSEEKAARAPEPNLHSKKLVVKGADDTLYFDEYGNCLLEGSLGMRMMADEGVEFMYSNYLRNIEWGNKAIKRHREHPENPSKSYEDFLNMKKDAECMLKLADKLVVILKNYYASLAVIYDRQCRDYVHKIEELNQKELLGRRKAIRMGNELKELRMHTDIVKKMPAKIDSAQQLYKNKYFD